MRMRTRDVEGPGVCAAPNRCLDRAISDVTSWQARTDLFDGVAGFTDRGWLSVQLSDRILPLRAVAVTDNLLEVLGLQSRFPEFDPAAAWISSRAAALSGGELGPGQSARIVPEGVLRV
jgi:hypothetical protein